MKFCTLRVGGSSPSEPEECFADISFDASSWEYPFMPFSIAYFSFWALSSCCFLMAFFLAFLPCFSSFSTFLAGSWFINCLGSDTNCFSGVFCSSNFLDDGAGCFYLTTYFDGSFFAAYFSTCLTSRFFTISLTTFDEASFKPTVT